MSAPPMTAGLAPNLVLSGGYVLRVTALAPTDGSTVADVIVSDVSLQVDSPDPIEEGKPIPLLPPVYAHAQQSGSEAPGMGPGG